MSESKSLNLMVYFVSWKSLEWIMGDSEFAPKPEKDITGSLVMLGRRGDVKIVESDDIDTQQLRDFLMNGFGERRETWGKRVGKRLVIELGKIVKKVELGESDPEPSIRFFKP